MLFITSPMNAKPYYLHCSINYNMQKGNKGSKAPKHPLCVDLSDNINVILKRYVYESKKYFINC